MGNGCFACNARAIGYHEATFAIDKVDLHALPIESRQSPFPLWLFSVTPHPSHTHSSVKIGRTGVDDKTALFEIGMVTIEEPVWEAPKVLILCQILVF